MNLAAVECEPDCGADLTVVECAPGVVACEPSVAALASMVSGGAFVPDPVFRLFALRWCEVVV
jgi:hypothetical protein